MTTTAMPRCSAAATLAPGCGSSTPRITQGVCLMFRREAFNARAIAQLASRSPISLGRSGRVYTVGDSGNPAATLMPCPATAGPDEIVAEHVRVQLPWLFFTKLLDWQSEHEYRWCTRNLRERGRHARLMQWDRARPSPVQIGPP